MATKLSTTGHFDMVLRDIDVMIENLRAEDKKVELEEEVAKTEAEKNQTLALMEEAKATRIEETKSFRQALKDDDAAVKLIDQALLVLSKVYGFVQKPHAHGLLHKRVDPEDSPPETFSGEYG